MKKIRIGNDIVIKWRVTINGEEVNLEGLDLSLYISTTYQPRREIAFTVAGNEITATYKGTAQKVTGVYRLTLYRNEGENSQSILDACDAFELVSCSCLTVDAAFGGAEVELPVADLGIGVPGLSAYEIAVSEGFEGTQAEWLASLSAASEAAAAECREFTEAAKIDERDRQNNEALRVAAENEREAAETARQSAEVARETAERSRTTAENERVTNETARSEAESSRATAETARQEAETARQEAEQGRVTAEQQRADAEAARAEEFAGFEGKINGLDSVVEKTVVSTKSIKNGGAGNGSNGYKVRTPALDIRDKSKIILTTDRPLTGNSHYVFEIGLINEEAAIGQFVANNENPNGYTMRFIGNLLEGDIVDCDGYSAMVIAAYEIPNDGKEGDIVLRKADFSNYRIGYSTNTANSELPSIRNSIKKFAQNVSAGNIYNGGAGNSSNSYKVRTEGLDVRGREYISITTDKPLTGDSYYEFECIFAQDEAAIGKSFSSNQNPNGYTLLSYRPTNMLIDSIIKVPSGASAVVVALCEIPNSGKEGDIVLRTTNFSGYSIGYNYGFIYKEIVTIQDRVTTIENSIEDINGQAKDAYQRNAHKSIALGAACRQRKSNNQSKDFQIIEITDSHSDAQSLSNCVDIANGFTTIDCLVHCGDAVGDYVTPQTSGTAIVNSLKNSTKPWYFVIGNHEAGTYNVVGYVPSQNKLYNEFVKPIVECGHLTDGEFQVGKCYYYHDFSNYGIRLICVNEYDGDLALDNEYWQAVEYNSSANSFAWNKQYNVGDIIKMPYYTDYCFKCLKPAKSGASIYQRTGQEPKYKAVPGCRMISQQQAEWFVNTLLATPENYGVVIAMHAPFSINAIVDTTKKFSQTIDVASGTSAPNRMEDDFFAEIVNAFINGLAYDKDIRFNDDADYLNTLTNSEGINYAYHLNVDFSKKSNGAKFLSYIGGHCHRDYVWKHPTYSKQWQVTPLCATVAPHQSPTSDIRRYGEDCLAYDSLTTISFNVNQRKISLVKIGCDVTETMEDRNYEIIELV